MDKYMKEWVYLNDLASSKGFTWGMLEEKGEWYQYMGTDVHVLSKDKVKEIELATERIGKIYQKMYHRLMEDFILFNRLGLPISTWEVTSIRSSLFSYITRFDLVVTDNEIKLLEANTDTPTGLVESSIVNKILCDYKGMIDINRIEEGLHVAWGKWLEETKVPKEETIYFTSYGWHEEDKMTTLFIMECCPHPHKKYVPIEEILVSPQGVYTKDGDEMTYVYRLYPLEFLEYDYADSGESVGQWFLDHVANGRVYLMNPPSAYMMQSKAVMALIWELYENKDSMWTKEELKWIEKYFLPTYTSKSKLEGVDYVVKPVLGREGGGVRIFNKDNELITQDEEMWYSEYNKVYQKYIEMPNVTIGTIEGDYTGKLLIGSFLLGGRPSGLFLRVGEKITGNLSMFIGVGVE